MSSSTNNDKLIKGLLKRYKKLEASLNKFNSKKYNHSNNGAILKGNILRTSLLPFLRISTYQLDELFTKDTPVYKSLSNVIVAVFIKWWNALISNLIFDNGSRNGTNMPVLPKTASVEPINYSNIPAVDRNAYLEAIGRIIAHPYWNFSDDTGSYQVLLTSTLSYVIDKLGKLKNITPPMGAFAGKVFAHAFFKLPNVSNALLFLLNVKQITFGDCLKKIRQPAIDFNNLKTAFPEHLHYLIGFQGLQNLTTRGQKCFMNCIPAPKHPVDGIKDPNGDWVRRWSCSDSNVFNSFFRHYINLVQTYLYEEETDTIEEVLYYCPGFNIIISHIYQIFEVSVTRITSTNCNPRNMTSNGNNISAVNPTNTSNGSVSPTPSNNTTKNKSTDSSTPPPPPPPAFSHNMKQSDMYYNSIIKIFRTVRDIAYSATLNDKSIDSVSATLVKTIDSCLIAIAKETTIHNFNKNGIVLSIVNEFINHIENNCSSELKYLVNWEFWLSCNYMMINYCDHVQSLLRNFAFLFNTWDLIPDTLSSFVTINENGDNDDDKKNTKRLTQESLKWITETECSFKLNFVNFLISDEVFERLFTHWNPMVRSYYIKLLIWRIIGINNYQSSTLIQVSRNVQFKLNRAFEMLSRFTVTYNGKIELNYKPDNPLVNRKFGVVPINIKDDYLSIDERSNDIYIPTATSLKPSELKKTHPYEVFDEAIYTCSNSALTNETRSDPTTPRGGSTDLLPNKPNGRIGNNNSLVNSLGRLFKILSTDDNDNTTKATTITNNKRKLQLNDIQENVTSDLTDMATVNRVKRNSISLTSLSTTYSFKSRSSSPSVMSYRSTPTSLTESSASTDDESVYSMDTLKTKSSSASTASSSSSSALFPNSYNIPPPELSRLPPEIIRPIYKFDVIVCHDSLNEKFAMIHTKNTLISRGIVNNNNNAGSTMYMSKSPVTSYFPLSPQIPFISIFVNSDTFKNRIYMNEEDGLFLETEFDTYYRDNNMNENNESFQNATFAQMMNLGKSLNEFNLMVEEFKQFFSNRVEIDSMNYSETDENSIFKQQPPQIQQLYGHYIQQQRGNDNSDKVRQSLIFFSRRNSIIRGGSKSTSTNNELSTTTNNSDSSNTTDSDNGNLTGNDILEFVYFKKIIPFLSVDSSNEMKLLNAN